MKTNSILARASIFLFLFFQLTIKVLAQITVSEVSTPDIKFCTLNTFQVQVQSSSAPVTFNLKITLHNDGGEAKFDQFNAPSAVCLNSVSYNLFNTNATFNITLSSTSPCTLTYHVVPTSLAISSTPIQLDNTYEINSNPVSPVGGANIYFALYPENKVTCAFEATDTVMTVFQTFFREVTLFNSCLTEPMDKPMWFKDTRQGPTCVRIIEVWYDSVSNHITLLPFDSIVHGIGVDSFQLDTSQINQIALAELDSNFCAQCRLNLILTYEVTCCFDSIIFCGYNTTWACDANDPPIYISDTTFNVTTAPPASCLVSGTLQIVPDFSYPVLNIQARMKDMNFCYGPDQLSYDTLRIINNNIPDSTGEATNILIELWQGGANGYTDIIDTTLQIRFGNNGPITTLVPDSTQDAYQSCDSNTYFRRLFLSIDTLAPLDTAFFFWRTRTCAPPDICSPSQAPSKDSWEYRIVYDGQCSRDTIAPLYTNLFTSQAITKMLTDFNGPYDISDTVVNNVAVDLSEATVWPAGDSLPLPRRLLVKITIGTDLQFVPDTGNNIGSLRIFLPTLPISCQNIFPVNDSLVPCDTANPSILYATFDISDSACFQSPPGLDDFHDALLFFSFRGLCQGYCAAGNAQDNIDTRIYYVPSDTCTPPPLLLVGCNNVNVQLHCPGCIRKGIHSIAYDIHRTTFGFIDCDNDNRWDGDSLCQPQAIDETYALSHPEIKRRRAMVGDVLQGTLNTLVVNNASYGPPSDTLVFPYAYWKIRIKNGYGINYGPNANFPTPGYRLRPMDLTLIFSPTDSSDSLLSSGPITIIIPDSVLYITVDSGYIAEYNLDFSISVLQTYFSDSLNPSYDSLPFTDFYDGLAITLTHRFRVQGNIISILDCDVNSKIYLGIQPENSTFNFLVDPDPIFGDTTIFPTQPTTPADYDTYCDSVPSGYPPCQRFQWYCTLQGGRFTLIGWAWFDFIGTPTVNEKCGGLGSAKALNFKVGPVPGNTGTNIFRYEYRNWLNMHRLKWDIPANYIPALTLSYRQYVNDDGGPIFDATLDTSRYDLTSDSVNLNYSYPDSVYQNGVDFNASPCGSSCAASNFGSIRKPDDDYRDETSYTFLPGCNVPDSTRADFYQEMDFIPSGGSPNFVDTQPWGVYGDTVFWAHYSSLFDSTTYSRHDTIIYKYQQRPQMSINAPSTLNGYRSPECLTFTVLNTQSSSNGDATHTWVAFRSDSCVSITSIKVDTIVYNNPVTDSLYYFNGVFLHGSQKNVTICFDYNCTAGCDGLRNIYLFAGWDCNRTSSTVATLTQYNDTLGCMPAKDTVQIVPVPAHFAASLAALTSNPSVCDTIEYNLQVSSTSFGALYHIVVTDTLPCSTMTYLFNSSQFIFDGDTISAEPDTSTASGGAQILTWNIDSISSYIDTNGVGYDSIHSVFILHYAIETGCGVCFQQRGISHIDFVTNCGVTGTWRRNFNPLLDSTNARFNDLSDTLSVASLNACNNRYGVTVDLYNNNDSTALRDNNYLEVIIPAGFATDSFSISPDTIIGQLLTWHLNSLSSITFQLGLDSAECGTHYIIANLFARDTLSCDTSFCYINELARTDTISFNIPSPDSAFICPSDTVLCHEPVQFTPEGLCGYFVWDFGDSTTSTLLAPTHIYDSAGTYTVTLTVYGNGSSAHGCSSSSTCTVVVECPERLCGGFCTYKPEQWRNGDAIGGSCSQSPPPNSIAAYLMSSSPPNFANTFGTGLVVGCSSGHTVTFTTDTAVRCFLFGCGAPPPNCITPSGLSADYINPTCNTPNCNGTNLSNSFIQEVVALTLNVYFDLADSSFSPSPYHLAYLHVIGPPAPSVFQPLHMSVLEILQLADSVIGGCVTLPLPNGIDLAKLNSMVKHINTSFNNCNEHRNTYGHMYDCAPSHGHMSVRMQPENGSCVNGYSANIIAIAYDGTLPYRYLWSTGDTTYAINGVADGTYTVTVIDAENDTVITETAVISSSDICCNITGNPFPEYPDNSNVAANLVYDVNFALEDPVEFYEPLLELDNFELHIMEGVQFIVEPGATLVLSNCTLTACGSMWKGIVVESGGTLILKNTIIKDAECGIQAQDGAAIYVYESDFEDNIVGIETPINDFSVFNDIDFAVVGTTFDFSGTLHHAYPGQTPFGTKPKAGIEFHDMMGTIGDDKYSENTFADMNCGIIAYSSVLTITDSKFRSIQDENFYSGDFMGSAIAAIGGDGTYSVDVTPFKDQDSTNATFISCDYGVYVDNNVNAKVAGCFMDSMITGVYVQACNIKNQIDIEYNDISAFLGGIHFYSNEGADLLYAGYNNIATSDEKGECIIASEPGSGENKLTIEENTLTCDGSLCGIDLKGCYASVVYHNTIDEISTIVKDFSGISISGGKEPIVSCNIINGLSGDNDYGTCGIKVNVTDDAVLHCNSTNLTTYGIAFFGVCATENNIKDNEMNEHYEGLHLNSNAIIGQQKHGGNLWLGPFGSSYGANNLNVSGGISVTASLFVVHEDSVTNYYPSIPDYDSTWFQVDAGGSPYSCADENECPDRSAEKSTSISPESLDNSIANNESLSLDFVTETKSMARQFLYKRLTDIPALLDSSSALDDFYTAYSDSSVKFLQQVRDSIFEFKNYGAYYSSNCHAIDSTMKVLSESIEVLDSLMNNDTLNAPTYIAQKGSIRVQANILQSSMISLKAQMKSILTTNISSANTINSNITTQHTPETNEQVINQIYLETVAIGNFTFDGSQASTVLDIAQQCPYAGGKAVYKARTLYQLVDATMEYDDDSVCFVAGIYRMANHSSTEEIEEGSIQLVPNPANENVTVIYRASSDGPCDLYVSDVTGKIVKKISIPCDKTRYEFSVSEVKNGLYLVNVLNNEQSIGRSKFAIIR